MSHRISVRLEEELDARLARMVSRRVAQGRERLIPLDDVLSGD